MNNNTKSAIIGILSLTSGLAVFTTMVVVAESNTYTETRDFELVDFEPVKPIEEELRQSQVHTLPEIKIVSSQEVSGGGAARRAPKRSTKASNEYDPFTDRGHNVRSPSGKTNVEEFSNPKSAPQPKGRTLEF